jgi:hypothetical protein
MKGLLPIATLTRMTTGSLLDFTGKWIPDLPPSTEHPHALSAAHPNPNFSTVFHRRAAGFCSILLTFMEIFSRLLGAMTPLWRQMKCPGILPPEQSACEYHCDRCLTFKAKRSVLRKNGIDAFSTKDA